MCFGEACAGLILVDSSTVSQNFDSLSQNTTNISSLDLGGWRFAAGALPTWSTGTPSTTQSSSTANTFSTGGTYNFGGTGADRGLGAMTSGSFASPNSLMLEVVNQTGSTITSLDFRFDWERYRINQSPARGTFFSSSDGINWTSRSLGNSGEFSTGASAYGTNSGAIDSVTRSGAISDISIAQGGTFYLRWTFETGGINSQAIGIDNFSITAVPEPSSMALVGLMGGVATVWGWRKRRSEGKVTEH